MKVFTLSLEVNAYDSSDDVAAKLERIARALRKQSTADTFAEDASVGSGRINEEAVSHGPLRGTWSLDP